MYSAASGEDPKEARSHVERIVEKIVESDEMPCRTNSAGIKKYSAEIK